jgi:hypothetical protein
MSYSKNSIASAFHLGWLKRGAGTPFKIYWIALTKNRLLLGEGGTVKFARLPMGISAIWPRLRIETFNSQFSQKGEAMNFDKLYAWAIGIVLTFAAVGKLDALQAWIWKAQVQVLHESRSSNWGSPRFFPRDLYQPPNERRSHKMPKILTKEVHYD